MSLPSHVTSLPFPTCYFLSLRLKPAISSTNSTLVHCPWRVCLSRLQLCVRYSTDMAKRQSPGWYKQLANGKLEHHRQVYIDVCAGRLIC